MTSENQAEALRLFTIATREELNKALPNETPQALLGVSLESLTDFITPLQRVLDRKGLAFVQEFIVPVLEAKLTEIESKTGFTFLIARAMLNGLKREI